MESLLIVIHLKKILFFLSWFFSIEPEKTQIKARYKIFSQATKNRMIVFYLDYQSSIAIS